MLPRAGRLRTPADFNRVSRGGRRGAASTVVVHLLEGQPAAVMRAGFVVSKKIGNSVTRHRVVRRLRAVVRGQQACFADGTELVVRALPAAAVAPSSRLEADLMVAVAAARRRRR